MYKFFSVTITVMLFVFCQTTYSQLALSSDSPLLGKWVSNDTAVLVTTDFMSKLYKSNNKWEHSNVANNQFYFVDAKIEQSDKVVELWLVARYTSHRDYLVDGSETSTETVDYRACQIEFIDRNTLKMRFTKTYSVNEQNKIPEIKLPDEIKADVAAKRYNSTITLTRLVE